MINPLVKARFEITLTFEKSIFAAQVFCGFEIGPSVSFLSIFATSISTTLAFSPHHLKILLYYYYII
jgi:hypothetical protein